MALRWTGMAQRRTKKSRKSSSKRKTRRWSQRVTETSDAMTLEDRRLQKTHARGRLPVRSSARPSTATGANRAPYRSAMSMLTFYINRAGKGLSSTHKRSWKRPRMNCATSTARRGRLVDARIPPFMTRAPGFGRRSGECMQPPALSAEAIGRAFAARSSRKHFIRAVVTCIERVEYGERARPRKFAQGPSAPRRHRLRARP